MKKLFFLFFVLPMVAVAGEVSVTSVTAQQRNSWSGLVDIVVTIQGESNDVAEAECAFVATNTATHSAISVRHITRNGDDTGSGNVWTRKFIWGARADVGAVKIDDVILSVDTYVGVQLWENGPYWAPRNVGATKPEEYGYYFWWGDTVGYKRNANNDGWVSVEDGISFSFESGNCPTCGKSSSELKAAGYIDARENLVSAHDAATEHFGAPWRLPTDADFSALINNCTTVWTTRNGVYGCLVTGKGGYSSKSIFLPAAGHGSGSALSNLGIGGELWSSTRYPGHSNVAWSLDFYSPDNLSRNGYLRESGKSVRPIREAGDRGGVGRGVSAHLMLDCTSADKVTVASVTARQRYPWNGLVDIVVTIQGAVENMADTKCTFAAIDSVTKAVIPVKHIMPNGSDLSSEAIWTQKFIWDANADIGAVKIDDVALSVDAFVGVQLWEGGPYWATCNVGASKPEECGYYFWWGDTIGYKRNTDNDGWISVKDATYFSFSSRNCPTYGKNKDQLQSEGYIDETGKLVAANDAATAHLGAPWRMPTDAELAALINNCDTEWTSRNGVPGRLVKGRGTHASKSIFLPAADRGYDSFLDRLGSFAYYWSSSLNADFSDFACGLSFSSDDFAKYGYNYRYLGQTVRPLRGFPGGSFEAHSDVTTHLSLDCRIGARIADSLQTLVYDASWCENGVSAKITVNGEEVVSGTAGTYAWMPTSDGVCCLTLSVYDATDRVVGSESVLCMSREDLMELVVPEGTKEIGDYAFANGQFTSVTIPGSVMRIGSSAFSGCSQLNSVTISDGVMSIGSFAFEGCSGLVSIDVPSSVANIESSAFCGCSGLVSMTLPFVGSTRGNSGKAAATFGYIFGSSPYIEALETKQTYGASLYSTFYIPSSLKRVVITDETEIGYGAFSSCTGLTSIEISNSVMKIKEKAFFACRGLTSITLPFVGSQRGNSDCVEALFGYVFGTAYAGGDAWTLQYYGESNISFCNIPSSLKNVEITDETIIGYGAFYGCSGISSVSIPKSVTRIGQNAFCGCSGLISATVPRCVTDLSVTFPNAYTTIKNIIISDDSTSIGDDLFYGCRGLASVAIPPSVSNIAADAFCCCDSLVRVDVQNLAHWLTICFENADANPLHAGAALFAGGEEVSELSIPVGVTEIGDYAFTGGRFTSVLIPKSVTHVAATAFAGCSNIVEISLPSGLLASNLADLFPGSVSEIERASVGSRDGTIHTSLLAGCESLKYLVIADNVKRIEAGSFNDCPALESVDFPAELEDFGLDLIPEPMRKLMGLSYDTDGFMIYNGWLLDYNDDYVMEMTVPEGVIGIGHWALSDLYDLETVRLPSTLKHIASGAFARDSYLDEVEMPDSVVRIGDGAFEDCSWLETITIGRGVESVGSRAFAGCTKLARIRFEDGLAEIGDCAFSNCWRMMSASLPLSVTNVVMTAFKDCDSLTGVNVPTSIAPLSQWFASVCRQIKNVTIPSGEALVCSNMFKGCSSLVSVDIPEGVTNIGDSAFEDCVNLPFVELPSSLQSVGESAFCNCDALTAIGLPDAVCSVGAYAFYDCSRLKDVSLSKNLESLPDRVFDACPQLDSIYVPASVTKLGSHIFGGAMSAVYFIGNAPAYDADVYASTGSGLVTYVKYGTKGWDGRPNSRDLPQKWPTENSYGRSIMTWDPVQFDVTFDAGEGVFYPVESQTYSCEQVMYTAYSLPPFNPVRKGYKFAGWWTEAVGGAEVTPSTGVKSDRPHTLYAHWDESFIVTVRFNACGGTVLPNEIEYTAEVPFGTLPVPTREHYIFTGWYTAASGGSIVRVSTEVPKADRELFAHWSPAHYTIRFNANNGTGATATQGFIYGQDVTLRANGFSCSGCEFVGWSLTPGGEAVYADGKTISGLVAIEDGVIDLYAVWTGNVYAVRFDSHGGLGVMPNQTFVLGVSQKLTHCTFTRSGYVFKGWALSTTAEVSYGDGEEVCNLTASKNATVVLFAVWERDPQGDWTVEEYLNCTNLTFTLGGDAPLWYGEKVARADKVGMMRSGAIGDSQTNWIETVVSGAGQIGFWWKANGEYEVSKKGVITRYDYAEFTIDGVPVEEIGDESDWTYVTIPVEGTGSHTLRWMYHKDESGSDGDDCAWLSEVSWEPTQALEPIPELPENPTAEDVQSALAGSADSTLLAHVTDAATYNAYREWALKIGAAEVKASPFAWTSFATDSAALLAKMPTDEDLKVEEFKPSVTAGSFDFTVSVKDVTIGDKASVDNLKKLFGLEGTSMLGDESFSLEKVAIKFSNPVDGKLKFTAEPIDKTVNSFFMRMKMK